MAEMTRHEIEAEALKMFEKWWEMFAPDDDRDVLDLAAAYAAAPAEQHAAAAKAAGLNYPPHS